MSTSSDRSSPGKFIRSVGATYAFSPPVAQRQFRLGQRSWQSDCRAATHGSSIRPTMRAAAAGLLGGCGYGDVAGQPAAVAPPSPNGAVNTYRNFTGEVQL